MLSMQMDELRELAGDGSMEWVAGPIRASVLSDAADTIWQLRERLRAAYAEIQELQEAKAENERLREVMSDAEDNARQILGENRELRNRVRELDELLPDNGRWYSAEVTEAYVAENANLRELVRILAYCMSDGRDCDRCALNGADMPTPRISACDSLPEMLRDLGVEVES